MLCQQHTAAVATCRQPNALKGPIATKHPGSPLAKTLTPKRQTPTVTVARRNQMQTRENESRSLLFRRLSSKLVKSDTKAEYAAKSSRTEMGNHYQSIKVHTRARLVRNRPKGVYTISQFIWLTKHQLQNK